jgi:protein O-GlcNAc transferase
VDTLEGAIELFRLGNAREAALACERRLAIAPQDVATLSLLAEIHSLTARHERASTALAQIIDLHPRDAAAHRRLAGALIALGRAEEAADTLRAAIVIDPTSARAHNNLGQALMQLAQTSDAIASYEEALRLDPVYAIAHNNLGLARSAAGDLDQALECFRHAIAVDPTLALAHLNAAVVFDKLDKSAEALQSYERALAAAPRLVEAWVGRGAALAKLHRWEPALECFETALAQRPDDSITLCHKAFALLAMDRAVESLAAADGAVQSDGKSAQAHNARAGALRRLGRRSEALQALEQSLALDPMYVEAWCNHGTVLHEVGAFEEAAASCRRALELNPNGIEARTRLLARLIPSVPSSPEEISAARSAFDIHVDELQSWLNTRELSESDALTVAQQQFFYLSYQEQSNRRLLQKYRGACAARLAKFGGLPVARPVADCAAQRFKIGFVSAHVHDHSVFNAILRGWLQCLDRERFDISLFSVGARQDALTRAAGASAEHFESGARSSADWARAIRDRELDALIYPEIGMNETTLALASRKLACRQFAAWGHPETSGLPTIDGYLSADLFEPPQAQEHYSEPLVRLPNLGVYCQPYAVASTAVDLAGLGIADDGPVLICPGVPFKYRPQDDWILVEIARRLGRCSLVFFQYEAAELSHKLQRRIAIAFERARLNPAEYLRWIPWQPRAAFFGLLRQADVYLDTIGFSGFNTMMQAIECHLPCVTCEGRFMRGRFGSAILSRMGLRQFIARDTREYVDLAVTLAADAGHRARIRGEIRRVEHRLYADSSAVDALGACLFASRGA